jgi:hypothetical protein
MLRFTVPIDDHIVMTQQLHGVLGVLVVKRPGGRKIQNSKFEIRNSKSSEFVLVRVELPFSDA